MIKTTMQQKLEAQRGQDIRQILEEALEHQRAKKHMVVMVAAELDLTDATVYQWCKQFGINIDEYRLPRATAGAAQES
jgi:ribosome-binding factor A